MAKAKKDATGKAITGEDFEGPILNGQPDVILQMLADGASPDTPFRHGMTPLQYLVQRPTKKAAEIAEILIKAGANIEVTHSGSVTPLMRAAKNGIVPLVKVLLASGADPKRKDDTNCTAMFYAADCESSTGAECVRLLLHAGLDPNEKWIHPKAGVMGGTPIVRAGRDAKPDTLRVLIEAGADVNVIGYWSWATALTSAISEKRADNVAVLLEAGADPHLRIPADHPNEAFAGKTAFELAEKMKLKKIVELLEAADSSKRGSTQGTKSGSKSPKPQPADIPSVWKRLEKAVKAVAPEVHRSLLKGAPDANILALEKHLKVELPDELKESYRIHNGQKHGEDGLIPASMMEDEYVLLSLDELKTEWSNWKKLTDDGEFKNSESTPDTGIRNDWWNPGWIPFAWDGGGNSLCVDLAPAKGGTVGQVILMDHESSDRPKIAASLAAFLEDVAADWEEKTE